MVLREPTRLEKISLHASSESHGFDWQIEFQHISSVTEVISIAIWSLSVGEYLENSPSFNLMALGLQR
jgi:hypothetical protein